MTQPINSGQPLPVAGVTGGPGISQGTASIDPDTGALVIHPDPANVTQFRKGNIPQSIQIYEYFNTNTDYSRVAINANTGGPFQLSVETAPGSVPRNLQIASQSGNVIMTSQGFSWEYVGGIYRPQTDAAQDIGDATHRVRNLFLSGSIPGAVARYSANGVAANPSTTSTTYVDMPDMQINFSTTVVSNVMCWFAWCGNGSVAGNGYNIIFNLDGSQQGSQTFQAKAIPNNNEAMSGTYMFTAVAAGAHVLKIQWAVQSGTLTNVGTLRNMNALVLP
jgi:hypothetical protein